MRAQAGVPVDGDSFQPGLHVLREPALVDAASLVAVRRAAGGLEAPIHPASPAQHLVDRKLAWNHIQVTCYQAKSSPAGSKLEQDVLQHSSELELLLDSGPVVAVHRRHTAGVAISKVDDCRSRAAGPLTLAAKGYALTLARQKQHRREAEVVGTYGCCVAELLGLLQQLALGGPNLLQQSYVRLACEGKPEVAQGCNVGHDNLQIPMEGLVLPVAVLPAPRPAKPPGLAADQPETPRAMQQGGAA